MIKKAVITKDLMKSKKEEKLIFNKISFIKYEKSNRI